mmetsp:Transcript_1191/g.820  ORF Transcript_1191/g.820 Transcript_1191/m.820 type:complete len:100 (+) Transcript_1191:127-426(+)
MFTGDPILDHLKRKIPRAQFLDLKFLRDQKSKYPYMMPSQELFTSTMRALDIKKTDLVVIYDESSSWFSSRAVFMFKAFGHTNTKLLDGGFKKWQADKL